MTYHDLHAPAPMLPGALLLGRHHLLPHVRCVRARYAGHVHVRLPSRTCGGPVAAAGRAGGCPTFGLRAHACRHVDRGHTQRPACKHPWERWAQPRRPPPQTHSKQPNPAVPSMRWSGCAAGGAPANPPPIAAHAPTTNASSTCVAWQHTLQTTWIWLSWGKERGGEGPMHPTHTPGNPQTHVASWHGCMVPILHSLQDSLIPTQGKPLLPRNL